MSTIDRTSQRNTFLVSRKYQETRFVLLFGGMGNRPYLNFCENICVSTLFDTGSQRISMDKDQSADDQLFGQFQFSNQEQLSSPSAFRQGFAAFPPPSLPLAIYLLKTSPNLQMFSLILSQYTPHFGRMCVCVCVSIYHVNTLRFFWRTTFPQHVFTDSWRKIRYVFLQGVAKLKMKCFAIFFRNIIYFQLLGIRVLTVENCLIVLFKLPEINS